MKTFSLEGFARFTEAIAVSHNKVVSAGLAVGAVAIRKKAHEIFGDNAKLASLAPSTQEERSRQGFTPNDPLVRTGELRDSLEVEAGLMMAGVGSPDILMRYHELGDTRGRYPPRPVLTLATAEAMPESTLSQARRSSCLARLPSSTEPGGDLTFSPPGKWPSSLDSARTWPQVCSASRRRRSSRTLNSCDLRGSSTRLLLLRCDTKNASRPRAPRNFASSR
jgi:hypothetical protein